MFWFSLCYKYKVLLNDFSALLSNCNESFLYLFSYLPKKTMILFAKTMSYISQVFGNLRRPSVNIKKAKFYSQLRNLLNLSLVSLIAVSIKWIVKYCSITIVILLIRSIIKRSHLWLFFFGHTSQNQTLKWNLLAIIWGKFSSGPLKHSRTIFLWEIKLSRLIWYVELHGRHRHQSSDDPKLLETWRPRVLVSGSVLCHTKWQNFLVNCIVMKLKSDP